MNKEKRLIMSEEERTIEIKTIATYKDKIVRVDKLLQYLFEENQKYKEVIEKAIEILKLCNSQCAKETIDILEEVKDARCESRKEKKNYTKFISNIVFIISIKK